MSSIGNMHFLRVSCPHIYEIWKGKKERILAVNGRDRCSCYCRFVIKGWLWHSCASLLGVWQKQDPQRQADDCAAVLHVQVNGAWHASVIMVICRGLYSGLSAQNYLLLLMLLYKMNALTCLYTIRNIQLICICRKRWKTFLSWRRMWYHYIS